MHCRRILCFAAWLMVGPSTIFAASIDSTKLAAIDAIAAKVLTEGQTPGIAIGIMSDGVVVFEKGFGLANLEHRVPVTKDTVFQVASITKRSPQPGSCCRAGWKALDRRHTGEILSRVPAVE